MSKIFNQSKGVTIASSAKVASGFFSRLVGLMFRRGIKKEEAFVFYRAGSIHTFFMLFPIDLIFLDRQMKVKRLVNNLVPWRTVFCKNAYVTIELVAGKISQSGTVLGDRLEIK